MAIISEVDTIFGETRELYLRVNNIDVGNHGLPAVMLVRGFLSKSSFDEGSHYIFEESYEFSADVSLPLWEQAYSSLKSMPDFASAIDA